MDGKPLYDYAREGIPLPRPIEKRKVTVYNLSVVDWKGNAHGYRYPEKKFTDEQKAAVEKAMHGIEDQLRVNDEPEQEGGTDTSAVACVLQMKVSGGTYVRSIVHNVGHAVDSAAHVVTLTRVHQGRFTLEPEDDKDVGCVPWSVFENA